uniref:NADH-ubiquinone oxidoreductase chain 2 n=1 Tax=Planusocoris schaeferi TaxID=2924051 RepID=A0A8T9EH43_9HEMI|nr:NADH dehydrogenase subunit 2 [Planusocoris schaeferi]UNA71161.1 NADH dehydrogenase subunit 2 [Planusocoris schaeferi]
MIFNLSKYLFLVMLISGSLMTLSANNWLGMWLGMEINLMSFIPFISKSKNKNSSQAMMIYFLIQSLGSIILLFSVTMNPMIMIKFNLESELMQNLTMISLVIKLGGAPFHWWVPMMMSNMNWSECFWLMTWQKMAPLTVMNNLEIKSEVLYTIVILSGLIGSIGGINQVSLRKLLAYSSINHLSWMMMFMSMSTMWYKYLMLYSMLMMLICYMLNHKNVYFINQMSTTSASLIEKYIFISLMLSIGGLPPFIGFLPKWMVIQMMINSKLFILLVIMLLMSLMVLFYYMRMLIFYILSFSTMNKWLVFKSKNNTLMYSIIVINFILPLFNCLNFF